MQSNSALTLILIVFGSVAQITNGAQYSSVFKPFVKLNLPEVEASNRLLSDTSFFDEEYDFIVIGAGSAGCVVANRLTEIEGWKVLLLEAGVDENFITDIPLLPTLAEYTQYDWGYRAEKNNGSCLGLQDGVGRWPRGKVLGGTSVINYMAYVRGNQRDYDHWAELGNSGWSYGEVQRFFKKSEDIGIPEYEDSEYHGKGGYLSVQRPRYATVLQESFFEAGKDFGYGTNDFNGKSHLNFNPVPATMRDGRRCSTAKAFIRPIKSRPNLHISKRSLVTKILIDPITNRAYGVEFQKNGQTHTVTVRKEVVLSAGSIGSPQILMLSGVGPKDHLTELGIPVIQDLPVGYNLHDHVKGNGVVFLINDTVGMDFNEALSPASIKNYTLRGQGALTMAGGMDGLGFVQTNTSAMGDRPDIELLLIPRGLNNDKIGLMRNLIGITDEFYNEVYGDIKDHPSFELQAVLMYPKSRGRISLKSKDPKQHPKLELDHFQDPEDLRVLREGVKLSVKMARSKAFSKYNATLHTKPFPACRSLTFESDDYWDCALRQIGSTLYHPIGTCKMGPTADKEAVVNPQLLVYGISNLRVADASIMPVMPSCHTNAPAIMIGEKAADMVKQKWPSDLAKKLT